jgi:hypothetical protein
MMRLPRPRHSFTALVLGGAIGIAALLQGGTAEAGRVRFGGGVHVNARWHGGVSVRYARPAWRPRLGGSIYVGGYYAPRSYYYYYSPEYVPSYYSGSSYYPVQPPAAAPGVVAAVAPERSLPTLGIGLYAGGTNIEGQQDSSDVGIFGRLRLHEGWLVEAELGKTTFENDLRVDRRIGGALIWELGARNSLAPYLLGGLGVQQAEVGGSFTTTQNFGEVGVGLRWALSQNLALTFDVRAGRRKTIDTSGDSVPVAARIVAPPAGGDSDDSFEDYTRGRLAAILSF